MTTTLFEDSVVQPSGSYSSFDDDQPAKVLTPPTLTSSKPKLRRKAPITDTLNDRTAVQRLVEYFVVVSSKPRWNTNNSSSSSSNRKDGGTPFGKSARTRSGSRFLRNTSLKLKRRFGSNNSNNSHAESVHEPESRQPETNSTEDNTTITDNGNIRIPQHHGPVNNNNNNIDDTYTFQPVITARYPKEDYTDNPLNQMITQFCYPSGDIITPTTRYEMPRIHHFVLTQGCGRKLYATCLTVLEEYDDNDNDDSEWGGTVASSEAAAAATNAAITDNGIELSAHYRRGHNNSRALYIPKVLCLLSTWPYLTAFREYLSQLYRLATTTNVMNVPIERYIVNICCEIPAPPPGAYEIQLPILDSIIRFWAPPAKLPIAYVSLPYNILFECLDVDHIITVFTALTLERKVLLISSQYSILTICSEILCSLLFPLRWSHLYVPLLPRMLCPMLDAPVPYLCGIGRENWIHAQQFVSPETMVVDLDRNSVKKGILFPVMPPLPIRKKTKLQTALTENVGDMFWKARGLDHEYYNIIHQKKSNSNNKKVCEKLRESCTDKQQAQWREKLSTMDHAFNLAFTPESPNLVEDDNNNTSYDIAEQSKWDCVQEAFLRFFVALLKTYRKHVHIPKNRTIQENGNNNVDRPTFDRIGFVASLNVDTVPFASELCMTQHFDDFLTRRMYSPGEPDLIFFDQSIDAKLNRSKLKIKKVDTPFLHSAKAHKELTKLNAVLPNDDGFLSSIQQKDDDEETTVHPFVYKKIPESFDESLFYTPRPIPKMISAEFDRQALLVSRLRANISTEVNIDNDDHHDNDNNLEFFGGDYDPNPEVAAFTVFLFVYCSLVGQDWLKYAQRRRLEEVKHEPISLVGATVETRDAAADDGEKLEYQVGEDSTLNELPFNCCGACPQDGITILSSTLSYIGTGAHDAYVAYFKNPVEGYTKFALSFDFQDDTKNIDSLKSNAAIAEYEEAKEVAAAQLEVAFETLATMTLRGLSVDSDAYRSLMEACGRCGDTKRALKLIEIMKKDGFVADNEVLGYFIAAFVHEDVGAHDPNSTAGSTVNKDSYDAYARLLKRNLEVVQEEKCCTNKCITKTNNWFGSTTTTTATDSVCHSDDGKSDLCCDESSNSGSEWTYPSSTHSSALMEWIHNNNYTDQPKKKRKRKKKRKKRKSAAATTEHEVTDMLLSHLSLGDSLLEVVYPNLIIDTNSDSCPQCSNSLKESDIVKGWKPCAFTDYTTECPKCHHRFVPRFVVSCSSPDFEGSQGPQTPLYCEYLSPWVLRKEFQQIIRGSENGIERVINPEWRSGTDIRATLFWNLLTSCRRYQLPYTFLLQGNFQNRLILPRKPNEV